MKMESSEEEDDFTYHEGITPQSKISSLYQSDTEKGIRKLCSELLDLKDSVENLCGNTRTKYLALLRLSEEVNETEHELVELRRHISSQAIMVQDLMSGVCHGLDEFVKACPLEPPQAHQVCELEEELSSETSASVSSSLGNIDILIAEHKVDEALEALEMKEKSPPELEISGDVQLDVSSCRHLLLERKQVLEEQLAKVAEQPSLGKVDFEKTLGALLKLGKGPLAHQLLLKRYGVRLKNSVESFLPSCSTFPKTYGAKLSQIVFSTILSAAKKSDSMFGDNPVYTNKVHQWAGQEIESFVRLVKDNGPPSEFVTALHSASVCVQASLGHCLVMEEQGLNLSNLLMVLLRPHFEEVLEKNFMRARREILDIDNYGDNQLLSPRFVSPLSVFAVSSNNIIVDSGLRFISVVKDIVEQLTPFSIMHFGANVLSRIPKLFEKFIDLLIKTLPSPSEDDGLAELKEAVPFKAESDSQQLAVLGAAYTVADELLPMALSIILNAQNEGDLKNGLVESIAPSPGNPIDYKDWRRQLQQYLDRLRDHFCQQYVLNFIYSREGKTRLDAKIYVDVDGEGEESLWDSDPFPSLPFQALFSKLRQLATIAGDVLLGKDKIQKILLARLTETVVFWLSDEQEFWSVFEDKSLPLKPFGLQQLILDMHFTVEIARFAGHSSRHVLQITSAITTRAIETYSKRGIDLHSLLPEDEWFTEAAKAAINKLLSGDSASEAASEIEEEHHLLSSHLDIDTESDDDDTISCSSTADSFVSAETGELGSPEFSSH